MSISLEKGISTKMLCEVIAEAQKLRNTGTKVLIAKMNKNKKFQKEQLINEGYEEFKEFYKNPIQ